MTCPQGPTLEAELLHGPLAPAGEAHLAGCADCRARLAALRRFEAALSGHRAPAGFAAGVLARLAAPPAPPARAPARRWAWLAVAAALLAALGLGLMRPGDEAAPATPAPPAGAAEARLEATPEAGAPPAVQLPDGTALHLELPARLRVGDRLAALLVLTLAGNVPARVTASVSGSAIELRPSALELTPSGRELPLELTAKESGRATLVATVRVGAESLSLRREVEVEAPGDTLELVSNLVMDGEETRLHAELHPEARHLETPRSVALRLIPSLVAEARLSLRGLVRKPHGCFEQTSAATHPSLLVLAIASARPDADSALLARARTATEAGARRLERFQGPDGGFSLHGRQAADPWLTAYGLQELVALSEQVAIEPWRIEAARDALRAFQEDDGSFPTTRRGPDRVAFTAFALSGLHAAGGAAPELARGVAWLEGALRRGEASPYGLVWAARLLLELPDRAALAEGIAGQLMAFAQRDEQGLFWPAEPTWTGSGPRSSRIELTALAALVLHRTGRVEEAAEARLWLAEQRRGDGFGGTQATVRTLEAFRLLDQAGGLTRGALEVYIAGRALDTLEVEPDGLLETALQVPGFDPDGSFALARQRGVELVYRGSGRLEVQLLARGRVAPEAALALSHSHEQAPPALRVRVTRPAATVGQKLVWTIDVENQRATSVNNPMVALTLPTGWVLAGDGGLPALVEQGRLQHWEIFQAEVVLYVQDLAPHQQVELPLSVLPRERGEFHAPGVVAYPYYQPEATSIGAAARVPVVEQGAQPLPVIELEASSAPPPPPAADSGPAAVPEDAPDLVVVGGTEEEDGPRELRIAWDPKLGSLEDALLARDLGQRGPLAPLLDRALYRGLPGCALEVLEIEPGRRWNVIVDQQTWQDGTPVTADDFAASWQLSLARQQLYRLPPLEPDSGQLSLLEELEVEVLAFNMLGLRVQEPRSDLFDRLEAAPFLPMARPLANGPYRILSAGAEEVVLQAQDVQLAVQTVRIRPEGSFEAAAPADLEWRASTGLRLWSSAEGELGSQVDAKALRKALGRRLKVVGEGPADRVAAVVLQLERAGFRIDRVASAADADLVISAVAGQRLVPLRGLELPRELYDRAGYVRWPLE